MFYSHFFIEHTRGHHKNVGTEADPATAYLNESVYPFIVRSMIGGYKSVWAYETKRLASRGISNISLQNRIISFTLGHIMYAVFVYKVFGGWALFYALCYALVI